MADEVDRAGDEAERYLAEAVRARKPQGPVANGRCHWCDEVVGETVKHKYVLHLAQPKSLNTLPSAR